MKKLAIPTVMAAVAGMAMADVATINNLDIRSGGVFGTAADNIGTGIYGNHAANATGVTINGVAPAGTVTADPIDIEMTYNNLDLDGDASANDSVTYTLRFTRIGGGTLRIFGQGVDTGYGNLNDVQVSMLSVSGTTTDSGDSIVFDGFTGAVAGSGSGGNTFTNTVDIAGINTELTRTTSGGFAFTTSEENFAAAATILFDNSSVTAGSGASMVARAYDLQFSTIPEPATLGMVIGFGGGILFIRRRFMM